MNNCSTYATYCRFVAACSLESSLSRSGTSSGVGKQNLFSSFGVDCALGVVVALGVEAITKDLSILLWCTPLELLICDLVKSCIPLELMSMSYCVCVGM